MIVVSILAQDLQSLRARALAQVPFADALELRLDALAHITESELRELVQAIAKPVIVAVNGPDAFGTFSGTPEERFAILARAARAQAAFVDVDWKEAPHQPPLPGPCRRIVSRHLTDGTPHDLATPYEALVAASRSADRLKFVTHASSAEDGIRLLEFARSIPRDFIAFASGEKGRFTRILAPIFGSASTYAAPARITGIDVGHATAPGQFRADEVRSHFGTTSPTRATEIFAVLGSPARHSLSPRLHNAVFQANKRDAVYVAIEPDDVTAFTKLLSSPNWRGFSVTAPFKEAALSLAQESDPESQSCGATNTLLRKSGGFSAFNTDVHAVDLAVRRALEALKIETTNVRALVVGNGGAARAAITALLRLRHSDITVTARNESKSAALARSFRVRSVPLANLHAMHFDVIVHCTPAGSRSAPNEIAIPLDVVRSVPAVVEAVYRPERTPLVELAESAGAVVVGGKSWFLAQAVQQAVRFASNGETADRVMRAELDRALAEDG